jgi:hypothetical protein
MNRWRRNDVAAVRLDIDPKAQQAAAIVALDVRGWSGKVDVLATTPGQRSNRVGKVTVSCFKAS